MQILNAFSPVLTIAFLEVFILLPCRHSKNVSKYRCHSDSPERKISILTEHNLFCAAGLRVLRKGKKHRATVHNPRLHMPKPSHVSLFISPPSPPNLPANHPALRICCLSCVCVCVCVCVNLCICERTPVRVRCAECVTKTTRRSQEGLLSVNYDCLKL